jgi:hypothetical protein
MKLHTTNKQTKVIAFGIMLSTLALGWISGCNKITSSSFSSNLPGTLQIKLTDAPARFDSVMIDIQKVEVQTTDSSNAYVWTAVNDSSMMVNLLDLSNGAYKVLGQKQLAPGTYHQIRLVLGPNNYVVQNGQEYALKVPSGQQSGLKINVDATIKPNYTYTLLLDFNAAKSIVQTGNSHSKNSKFILKPVIRATNEAISGVISGTVSPANTNPTIYSISGTDTVSTAFADTTTGNFKMIGIPAGTYNVSFVPADTTYRDTTITGVSVVAGQTQQLGTVTLSKK